MKINLSFLFVLILYISVSLALDFTIDFYKDRHDFLKFLFISKYLLLLFAFLILFKLFLDLKTKQKQLNLSIRQMNSSMSMFTHALKNEVSKISLGIHNLKVNSLRINSPYIRDITEKSDAILDSTKYLLKVIGKFKELNQKFILKKQLVNIYNLIDEVIINEKTLLKLTNLQIENQCTANLVIVCDKIHIQEIIKNLIRNSKESIQHNKGKIIIESQVSYEKVTIKVKDNGIGISKINLQRVGEPFFTTKDKQLNYGLGLSYCLKIMHFHGGDLDITSKENKGTTVSLNFPKTRI
ncbi:sensor histidine kinase [Priestia megaterium]|uniref:sensor histidine kinase n=1 Tax=Priestia megaterium TaxID=1404 RepID=UPI00077D764B|nr:HAMP domain-containing sensor histidine kinase [Priestia megaterium]